MLVIVSYSTDIIIKLYDNLSETNEKYLQQVDK